MCSEVTITRADGTVTVQPALTKTELRRLIPERFTIPPSLRSRILKRDRQTCRYCRTIAGPFEIDHVVPVALGGATAQSNLVTACAECNRKKSAQIWKPIPLVVMRCLTA
ncbi:MAG: HNH endonuclease [Candidatus Dormibacteria bacterium]